MQNAIEKFDSLIFRLYQDTTCDFYPGRSVIVTTSDAQHNKYIISKPIPRYNIQSGLLWKFNQLETKNTSEIIVQHTIRGVNNVFNCL